MKILFTADLHIKLGQKNVQINWAINRYHLLFKELEKLGDTVDLIVLGGDIFDKIPSMEELALYFDLVDRFNTQTVIYSGNHEALKKNTTFLTSLRHVTSSLNDRVVIIDDFWTYKDIDFIPYNKLKEPWPEFHSKILCTHVRGDIPPHVKAEIPLESFERWDTVLAGDLHSYSNSQRNILYPGSPITTSFHRNSVDTGVIIFDTSTHTHEWVKLKLPQLIRKTIQAGEPMPQTKYDHTIYEIEGDMSQLSDMENSDLMDKKILKRETDTTLILSKELSIEEEVEEYLTYVLGINESSIKDVLKELNNHIGKIRE